MSVSIQGTQIVFNDGSIQYSKPINQSTASLSGTAVDITGIPSWAKRICITVNSGTANGSSFFQAQLGTASGIETTGYACAGSWGGGAYSSTTGLLISVSGASSGGAYPVKGSLILFNQSGNVWVGPSGATTMPGQALGATFNNHKALASTLDRVRLTTLNGTDSFSGGAFSVFYE